MKGKKKGNKNRNSLFQVRCSSVVSEVFHQEPPFPAIKAFVRFPFLLSPQCPQTWCSSPPSTGDQHTHTLLRPGLWHELFPHPSNLWVGHFLVPLPKGSSSTGGSRQ